MASAVATSTVLGKGVERGGAVLDQPAGVARPLHTSTTSLDEPLHLHARIQLGEALQPRTAWLMAMASLLEMMG